MQEISTKSSGFTLAEILVSAFLLTLFALAGSAAITATATLMQQGKVKTEGLQTVQINLEQVRQAAISFCKQKGSSNYGPQANTQPLSQECEDNKGYPSYPGNQYTTVGDFNKACDRHALRSLQLGQLFLNYLIESKKITTETIKDSATGRIYTIKVNAQAGNNSNEDPSTGRMVTLAYEATTPDSSQVIKINQISITPNAAAWCPIQYE
jgi:Tfp pilus assembly protein PilV